MKKNTKIKSATKPENNEIFKQEDMQKVIALIALWSKIGG
jgi:hypothetical protein